MNWISPPQDKLVVSTGQSFSFTLEVEHDKAEEVITTIALQQDQNSMDPIDGEKWLPEKYWHLPRMMPTKETHSTVKVVCTAMSVLHIGVYFIKAAAWVPDVITGPKWELLMPLTVISPEEMQEKTESPGFRGRSGSSSSYRSIDGSSRRASRQQSSF